MHGNRRASFYSKVIPGLAFSHRCHFVAMILMFTCVAGVRAEVIHGEDTVRFYDGAGGTIGGVLDLDSQTVVRWPSSDSDIGATFPLNCHLGAASLWLRNGTTILAVDSTLEELTTAPPLPYGTDNSFPPLNTTYVAHTSDGAFAKFTIRDMKYTQCIYVEAVIEYYVQTDGSRDFGPEVGTESTTWSRIKALYR